MTVSGRLRRSLRRPESLPLAGRGRLSPLAVDAALGVTLAVLALATYGEVFDDPVPAELTAGSAILLLLQTLPLAFRRARPDVVMTVVGVSGVVMPAAGYESSPFAIFAILVAVYTMAARGRRVDSLLVGGATVVALAIVHVAGDLEWGATFTNYLVFGVVWMSGETVRARRAYAAELEERAAYLEADRERRAERAVEEERERIARELHDVVAHEVSVMVVQAGAARRVLADRPDQAGEALAAIEASGREALDELRRLLGVIRDDNGGPGRAPQPGLARLDALVGQMAEAGLPVTVAIEGEPRPLPPGLDLNAYRIVQEALTNCLKHAGPEARAQVVVRFSPREVGVEVADDGRGVARGLQAADATGLGLAGMRERAALFGGHIQAGPRPGGGFRVTATLPVGGEAGA